jgi:hypothetical protein
MFSPKKNEFRQSREETMTSFSSRWTAAAVFAALGLMPVQGFATLTPGAPFVATGGTVKPSEIKIAPGGCGTGCWIDFGSDTPSNPMEPEIKLAPTGGCGSACEIDFGLNAPSIPVEPEIKVAPACPSCGMFADFG